MEGQSKPEYLSGYSNKVFITDGDLVTSRGPGAAEEFAMELVRILAGEEVYRKVHDSAQMR
jgi:4-methyl-5(b-hydroxyethyl)-thiazole monophosphate biosynthesis